MASGDAANGMTALVDTKLLGKPQIFSGNEMDWSDWTFQVKACLGCVHIELPTLLEKCEYVDQEVSMDTMEATVKEASRKT